MVGADRTLAEDRKLEEYFGCGVNMGHSRRPTKRYQCQNIPMAKKTNGKKDRYQEMAHRECLYLAGG